MRALDASVASFRSRAETLEETVSFCQENPENFYYLDADDFITMTEPVLKEGETDYKNVESEGSWLVRSPMYQQKIGAYGFSNMTEGLVEHDNVYYLSTTRPDILIKYIQEEYEDLRMIRVGSISDRKVCFLESWVV